MKKLTISVNFDRYSFWIGVEKKILNYTTYDYNWINGNTGKIMNYTLFPTSWRRSLKAEKVCHF